MPVCGIKLEPFTIYYTVEVKCRDLETVDDETPEQARRQISEDLRKGFRQIAYDIDWNIEEAEIREGVEN